MTSSVLEVLRWTHVLTVMTSEHDRSGVIGLGVTIRERRESGQLGPIIARISEPHVDLLTEEPLGFAVIRALEIAHERGLTHILVRSHYGKGSKHRRRERRCSDSYDSDRARIRELIAMFPLAHFGAVSRVGDASTRKLARAARVRALAALKARRKDKRDHPDYDPAHISTDVVTTSEDDFPDYLCRFDPSPDLEIPF